MRFKELWDLSMNYSPVERDSPHEVLVKQLLGAATLAVALQEGVACLFLVHGHLGFILRRDKGGTRIPRHEQYCIMC